MGGGGGSQPSPRPPVKLNPLRLLGNGGRPCKEDIAILSCILKKAKVSFKVQKRNTDSPLFARSIGRASIDLQSIETREISTNRTFILRDFSSLNDLLIKEKKKTNNDNVGHQAIEKKKKRRKVHPFPSVNISRCN